MLTQSPPENVDSETLDAALPSDEDVRSYQERGWFLSGRIFADDEIDALYEATERYYAGERSRTLPARPPRLAYWTPADGENVMRHNDYVHYESDPIAGFLLKPLLGEVAARLAMVDEIRVFQSTLIRKPAIAGLPQNIVPWHFDKHYWASSTSTNMLTAFIPLHDCTLEMGTITMVDGSHRWAEVGENAATNLHFADRDPSQLEQMLADNAAYNGATITKSVVTIPKGHVSFHHCRTYHGSGPNVSGRPRNAISLHLQDGANAYHDYVLPDGSTAIYNHDSLVRRTADGRPDYADPQYCPVIWRADDSLKG